MNLFALYVSLSPRIVLLAYWRERERRLLEKRERWLCSPGLSLAFGAANPRSTDRTAPTLLTLVQNQKPGEIQKQPYAISIRPCNPPVGKAVRSSKQAAQVSRCPRVLRTQEGAHSPLRSRGRCVPGPVVRGRRETAPGGRRLPDAGLPSQSRPAHSAARRASTAQQPEPEARPTELLQESVPDIPPSARLRRDVGASARAQSTSCPA